MARTKTTPISKATLARLRQVNRPSWVRQSINSGASQPLVPIDTKMTKTKQTLVKSPLKRIASKGTPGLVPVPSTSREHILIPRDAPHTFIADPQPDLVPVPSTSGQQIIIPKDANPQPKKKPDLVPVPSTSRDVPHANPQPKKKARDTVSEIIKNVLKEGKKQNKRRTKKKRKTSQRLIKHRVYDLMQNSAALLKAQKKLVKCQNDCLNKHMKRLKKVQIGRKHTHNVRTQKQQRKYENYWGL